MADSFALTKLSAADEKEDRRAREEGLELRRGPQTKGHSRSALNVANSHDGNLSTRRTRR
jgi:hypothetical protein